MDMLAFLEGLLRDARHALRMLRMNPGFSAAAILSLVLMTVAFIRIAERDSLEIQPLFPSSPPEGASSD